VGYAPNKDPPAEGYPNVVPEAPRVREPPAGLFPNSEPPADAP
jgi:hypothetical protein